MLFESFPDVILVIQYGAFHCFASNVSEIEDVGKGPLLDAQAWAETDLR